MADGARESYEVIAVHNTWMGVFNRVFSCWGASMWGDATADGELLHMRSVDGMNMIQDPITGSYLYDNQVILVRNPDDALRPGASADEKGDSSWKERDDSLRTLVEEVLQHP